MQTFKLSNGMQVIYNKKDTDSVTAEIMVKVGSNYETKKISGVSHMIEHLVFEATKKYPTSQKLANEVEKFGGELNAYTGEERTAFYVKILRKHFDKALDILEQVIFNPLFRNSDIEKEKSIIIDEIRLVTDEPRFHQWVFFGKTLFQKHPAKNPAYGTIKAVKGMTKNDILHYYSNHYIPNNMIISVAGNINDLKQKLEKKFKKYKKKILSPRKKVIEPKQTKPKIAREKRKLSNSYFVFGYKTPPRLSKDSCTLDVLRAILGRGQSGKLFYEIRTKLGLAYDVGVHHDPSTDYGFFAVYCGTDKKNINKIKNTIIKELKLKDLNKDMIQEAKDYIEGSFRLQNEDTHNLADQAAFWALMGNPEGLNTYIKNIKKVTKADIQKVIKKYFTRNYTIAVLEQI
ncbi:insulinase family protein [Candidatus Woesearchaeota archaeon]|nr:insulinase family protein [Candidatus Woesearchaeota archaeon]